jgi:uncharacterized membrane protein HdeD (DUF308 family)
MLKSLSTSLIMRGVLALAVGIIALAWPQVTVLALVILFAVYAFIAAGLQAMQAFSSAKAGSAIGHLLLALVDIAAGVIALAWPGPTALVLVLIVGIWAIIGGLVEIGAAFRAGEPGGTRAMFILGGLVTVAFGVVLCARPDVGALTLALLFGLFSLIYGAGHSPAASSCAARARPCPPWPGQGKRPRTSSARTTARPGGRPSSEPAGDGTRQPVKKGVLMVRTWWRLPALALPLLRAA